MSESYFEYQLEYEYFDLVRQEWLKALPKRYSENIPRQLRSQESRESRRKWLLETIKLDI